MGSVEGTWAGRRHIGSAEADDRARVEADRRAGRPRRGERGQGPLGTGPIPHLYGARSLVCVAATTLWPIVELCFFATDPARHFQIVGANKFRTASAEIADKIRRLVEILQVGLQVCPQAPNGGHQRLRPCRRCTHAHALQLEAIEQNNEILNNLGGLDIKLDGVASDVKDVVSDVKDVASDVRGVFGKVVPWCATRHYGHGPALQWCRSMSCSTQPPKQTSKPLPPRPSSAREMRH